MCEVEMKEDVRGKPESIVILDECADLQLKKSNDYQNPNSRVKQSDYYPSGVKTIAEQVHGKLLRVFSLIEAFENDAGMASPNFESIQA